MKLDGLNCSVSNSFSFYLNQKWQIVLLNLWVVGIWACDRLFLVPSSMMEIFYY